MSRGDDYDLLFRQLRQEGVSKGAARILVDRFKALHQLKVTSAASGGGVEGKVTVKVDNRALSGSTTFYNWVAAGDEIVDVVGTALAIDTDTKAITVVRDAYVTISGYATPIGVNPAVGVRGSVYFGLLTQASPNEGAWAPTWLYESQYYVMGTDQGDPYVTIPFSLEHLFLAGDKIRLDIEGDVTGTGLTCDFIARPA